MVHIDKKFRNKLPGGGGVHLDTRNHVVMQGRKCNPNDIDYSGFLNLRYEGRLKMSHLCCYCECPEDSWRISEHSRFNITNVSLSRYETLGN